MNKSEYSEFGTNTNTTDTNQFDGNFPFDQTASIQLKTKETEESNTSENNSDDSELPILLSPPLTDEEISADLSAIINEASDLNDLDMMIQSAGPFQHPRSVAQNYGGHGTANMYHRQPSYHSHHHHHQVSQEFYYYLFFF